MKIIQIKLTLWLTWSHISNRWHWVQSLETTELDWLDVVGGSLLRGPWRTLSNAPAAMSSVHLWLFPFSSILHRQTDRQINRLTGRPTDRLYHSALLWFTNTIKVSSHSSRSVLLPSLPVLPASCILEGSCRGVRCHQPISHPLVDQGGVRSYSTQQHGEASVQHVSYAAHQRWGRFQFG